MTQLQKNGVYDYESVAITHPGHVRKFNEDSIFANAVAGIWIVADGMGGHKDGNVASAMIAAAAGEFTAGASLGQFTDQLQAVNAQLLALSNGDSNSITGSTVVALLIRDNTYTCIWAGDSRCYLARSGRLTQISHDHTEVQDLVDQGMITKDEARSWPRRNVITRAVGAHEDLELDSVSGSIEPGDCFLLCSDGLTGHLNDDEILDTLSDLNRKDACDRLLELALERGGKDNISIIAVSAVLREATTVMYKW